MFQALTNVGFLKRPFLSCFMYRQAALQNVSDVEGVSVAGVASEIEVPSLNYPLLPTLVITATAYLIATCFFSVYEMAIDTLFLCFLQDSEINDGSKEKPYFMSKYVQEVYFIIVIVSFDAKMIVGN